MKKIVLAATLLTACSPAMAKNKIIPLSEADAAALQGKTVAMTVHERPSFVANTASKTQFGLLGVAAMISAGNKLVDENGIQDPAAIVRAQLAAALGDAYSLRLLPADGVITKAKKPSEIAALHPEADYVLDVRSGGWSYNYFYYPLRTKPKSARKIATLHPDTDYLLDLPSRGSRNFYYPTEWLRYRVDYGIQVQLVNVKSGRQISNATCYASTYDNPNAPTREQLEADGAKLLKQASTALGWACMQLLAKEQFVLSPERSASIPPEFSDPFASLPDAGTATAKPMTGTGPAVRLDTKNAARSNDTTAQQRDSQATEETPQSPTIAGNDAPTISAGSD